MGHQDWNDNNAFFNPRPAALPGDTYRFDAAMTVMTGVERSAEAARRSLRALRNPLKLKRDEAKAAALNLRTAAHWAELAAWRPVGQDEAEVLPELRIHIWASQQHGRVTYQAESTWNALASGSTAREAVDKLLDAIVPK